VGQHKFYVTLSNFLGIIGYWAGNSLEPSRSWTSGLIAPPGTWVSAVCVEHLYFRKGNFAHYDLQAWNVPSQLPLGAAALSACALSFALVIPSMSQVWYTGPIARTTGDIGFEMAVAVTTLLYIPLRHLEKRWRGV
jgi:purine-cytosine permease-like protein